MSKIDPSLYLSNVQTPQRTGNGSSLGKDEFLKILMTQLQNQDPMNPMEDKEFIAQMASFSSLEQLVNMAASLDKFVQAQQSAQMVNYQSFVGKDVTWHKIVESTDPNAEPVVQTGEGTIASIRFKENGAEFVMADGSVLEPANISEVKSGMPSVSSSGYSLVDASRLIGYTVAWQKDGQEQTDHVQSVSMKDGMVTLQLANGERVSPTALTEIRQSKDMTI